MLKVNRKELDKMIATLNLYPITEKVCEDYRVAASRLDEKEGKLREMLADLGKEHAGILLSLQATVDVSEMIYLQKQARELVRESNTIEVMLEEIGPERLELKLSFLPKFKDSLEVDRNNRPDYSVIETVKTVRWELIKGVYDLAVAMQKQQEGIPEAFDVLYDPAVIEAYPHAKYLVNQAQAKPLYEERLDTVISRYMLFSAVDGNIHPELKPEDDNE